MGGSEHLTAKSGKQRVQTHDDPLSCYQAYGATTVVIYSGAKILDEAPKASSSTRSANHASTQLQPKRMSIARILISSRRESKVLHYEKTQIQRDFEGKNTPPA
ncbi:hypothetical protein COLO4_09210 [Corchorus olitorius]|uniref:Uncharacterized protein n=1 Tax=Corchorus olitorius TaxID=93759 RepID=A0A1R3KCT8_9ROSI|nr:hypothetical protein COLO4_09210 [Corchorus olitorius]